jgi:hypothetical protein
VSTKLIKVAKDVYDALYFCKGMNINESTTNTLERLFADFQFDCIPKKVNADGKIRKQVFMLEASNGKLQMIPNFSKNRIVTRVTSGIYDKLIDATCYPGETVNMTIFRLLCSHYQNKYIYRIFTSYNCGNCDRLHDHVAELMAENKAIADNIYVEYVDGNATVFGSIIKSHDTSNFPVSILYTPYFKEVWSTSGYHDTAKVTRVLEKAASKS